MFTKIFSKPLRLAIDNRTVTFDSVDDFDFALSGRTEVPWQRITDSLRLSDEELTREAEGIKKVESRFVDAISSALEDQTSIGRHFREMDIKLFSQDHQWRSIIAELTKQDPEYDEYKKVALVKYMQYLSSRQEVVQSIFADRMQRRGPGSDAEGERVDSPDARLRETVIFDFTRVEPPASKENKFARLPKGEAISIPLSPGQEVGLLLSKQRFRIVCGKQCYLVDDNGADYLLKEGRNCVGRDEKNDVVVNASYRDVSRRHLVIEIQDRSVAHLTDLSSHGTFVPPQYVDQTAGR